MGGRGSSSGSRASRTVSNAQAEANLREYFGGQGYEITTAREQARRAMTPEQRAAEQDRERRVQEQFERLNEAYGGTLRMTTARQEQEREQANAEASKRLRSAKAPVRGKPIEVTNADGEKGIILRATPGYRTGDRTGDTMYDVRILNADGKEVWRTTRRGSGALPRAKDDVALQLGLQRVKHPRTRWEYGEV